MKSNLIRKADAGDANRVAQIHICGWRDAYGNILDPEFLENFAEGERRNHWQSELTVARKDQTIFVMDNQGELTGFICVKLKEDAVWGTYIDSLHVSATARGQGTGKALLQKAAQWIMEKDADSPIYLWVFEDNSRAIAFYQRLGGDIVEQATSEMPFSRGAPALRIAWKSPDRLLEALYESAS